MNNIKNMEEFESELNINPEFFGLFRDELLNIDSKKNNKIKLKDKSSTNSTKYNNKSHVESTRQIIFKSNLDNTSTKTDIIHELDKLIITDNEIKQIKKIMKFFNEYK
jgi:hypothetical protein